MLQVFCLICNDSSYYCIKYCYIALVGTWSVCFIEAFVLQLFSRAWGCASSTWAKYHDCFIVLVINKVHNIKENILLQYDQSKTNMLSMMYGFSIIITPLKGVSKQDGILLNFCKAKYNASY